MKETNAVSPLVLLLSQRSSTLTSDPIKGSNRAGSHNGQAAGLLWAQIRPDPWPTCQEQIMNLALSAPFFSLRVNTAATPCYVEWVWTLGVDARIRTAVLQRRASERRKKHAIKSRTNRCFEVIATTFMKAVVPNPLSHLVPDHWQKRKKNSNLFWKTTVPNSLHHIPLTNSWHM